MPPCLYHWQEPHSALPAQTSPSSSASVPLPYLSCLPSKPRLGRQWLPSLSGRGFPRELIKVGPGNLDSQRLRLTPSGQDPGIHLFNKSPEGILGPGDGCPQFEDLQSMMWRGDALMLRPGFSKSRFNHGYPHLLFFFF